MKVVEVNPSDRELIFKIHKNEIESFGEMGGADMWMIMSFIRYGKLFVLIDKDEKLLSVAQYQSIFQKNEVFLYGFSTPFEERGKGYGKKLLEETHKLLKKKGIFKIFLTVDPKNLIAIKMYAKLGYKVKELQKNEYGLGIDRYLMYKNL
ncbi:MAG: GNAT family N-acetyltransferase [Cetobacterium sp.]